MSRKKQREEPGCRRVARKKVLRWGCTLLLWGIIAFLITAWFGGCASPIEGLWPPAPGEPTYRIIVSVDSWHSMIGIWPEDDPEGIESASLEEWGYAERGYYLEGDSGSSGTMRALFWPSTGVVQVTCAGRPWSERTPQPPARAWSFNLTERGYENLKAHLTDARECPEPFLVRGAAQWYIAAHDYCAFHHCHHWTARALRAAGLPIWTFYALFKWSFEAQLDRALKFVEPPECKAEIGD